jgi:hypothetical protein
MEYFRGAVTSRHFFLHEALSSLKQLFFHPRFTFGDCGNVWIVIKAYINKLCGGTPTHLRIRVPGPITNFSGLSVALTKTQRKAAINAPTTMDKTHVNWRTGWKCTSTLRQAGHHSRLVHN